MSRLKNLFFGKFSGNTNSNSNISSNRNPKSQSYETAVARSPPVKGSYPVAGNGPNVLEEIQRSRAKRNTQQQSAAATAEADSAEAPSVPRFRAQTVERPRTAPNNSPRGTIGSVNLNGNGSSSNGRTRSGFSMKSPPNFFSNGRNSLRNTVEQHSPVPTSPVQSLTKLPRDVQTYQPRKVVEAEQFHGGTTPFARHTRADSRASHKSFVDLLEAHSNIRPSRETSQNRAKAAGVRNYGEDVADRNMVGSRDRDPRLDLNSSETVYAPNKRSGLVDGGSKTSSALGHVLGHAGPGPSDDIVQPLNRHAKASSIRSTATPLPRLAIPYPPRTSSAYVYATATNDDGPTSSVHDHRVRALSPLSTSSIGDSNLHEEFRQSSSTPERGRRTSREPPPITFKQPTIFEQVASTSRVSAVRQAAPRLLILEEPPPVSSPTEFPRARPSIPESRLSNSSSKQKQRAMSSTKLNGPTSRSGSSAFSTNPSDQSSTGSSSITSPVHRQTEMLVKEQSEPITLESVVDVSNTVDTDAITKTLPAVTHEHVTPTRHDIREERITREIHTHDIYHRILPVIETEILPTKHYVPSDDGKGLIEIAENDLHKYTKHTVTGKPNNNWRILKDEMPPTQTTHSHAKIDEDDGADGPIIGLARDESNRRSRACSLTKSGSLTTSILEPILSSKKEYISNEGHPKTEYVWRHPPVFEDVHGRTQPMYIGAGLGDLSSPDGYYSDEDPAGAAFGAERDSAKGEEDLLFRDSGYGHAGMLPGLGQPAPVAKYQTTDGDHQRNFSGSTTEDHRSGHDIGEDFESGSGLNYHERIERASGEATKALQRMRERRRSSAGAATGKGKGIDMMGLERGMNGMHVR